MVWLSAKSSKGDDVDDLDNLLIRAKPLKRRGLSKFYSSKSQSFSSLDLALSSSYGDSAVALGKQYASSRDIRHLETRQGSIGSQEYPSMGSPESSPKHSGSLWQLQEEMCSAFIGALKIDVSCDHQHRSFSAATLHPRHAVAHSHHRPSTLSRRSVPQLHSHSRDMHSAKMDISDMAC